MDKLMSSLQAYVGSEPMPGTSDYVLGRLLGFHRRGVRPIAAYLAVFPKGGLSWMHAYGDTSAYNNCTRVRMPRSFLEWTVARGNGPMKPFNYMLTEGDKRGLEQAGFIDLPE